MILPLKKIEEVVGTGTDDFFCKELKEHICKETDELKMINDLR